MERSAGTVAAWIRNENCWIWRLDAPVCSPSREALGSSSLGAIVYDVSVRAQVTDFISPRFSANVPGFSGGPHSRRCRQSQSPLFRLPDVFLYDWGSVRPGRHDHHLRSRPDSDLFAAGAILLVYPGIVSLG